MVTPISFDRFYTLKDPSFLAAFAEAQPAELVSPMVAYLGHESCELTGGLFDSSAGTIQARVFGTTPGYSSRELTIEDVRDHLDELLDIDNLVIATDPRDAGETGNDQIVNILEARPYQPL